MDLHRIKQAVDSKVIYKPVGVTKEIFNEWMASKASIQIIKANEQLYLCEIDSQLVADICYYESDGEWHFNQIDVKLDSSTMKEIKSKFIEFLHEQEKT